MYALVRPVLWAVCLTLLVSGIGYAQGQLPFQPGKLTGSHAAAADSSQRYVVYLPSTFDPARPAPILFVLDYRGRARSGAEVFIPAAERFGWIVMSSANSSSDVAAASTIAALQAMWADAHDLLPIDTRRIYLAGLSGTARMATWLGTQVTGTVTGVIGAAAGFAHHTPPTASTPFLYFGTVGNTDYNYWEMRALNARLTELQRPHRIVEFQGAHGWMPPRLAMEAIEWMELQAMRSGLRPVAPALVEAWFWRDLNEVDEIEEAGRPLDAARRADTLLLDYQGLRPAAALADLSARRTRLAVQVLERDEARAEAAAARDHAARVNAAMAVLSQAVREHADDLPAAVGATLDALEVTHLLAVADGRDPTAARAARRVLAELDVQTGFYLPMLALERLDVARAAFYLDIAKAINERDSFAWYLRADVLARSRRTAASLEALTKAVDLGFRSLDALEHNRAFSDLRDRSDYQALLARVRAAWEQ